MECPDALFELAESEDLLRAVWLSEDAQKNLSKAFEAYRAGGCWGDYSDAIEAREAAAKVFDKAIYRLRLAVAKILEPV